MNQSKDISKNQPHKKRFKKIGHMLWEMRFAEGKNQDAFSEYGISRRQIQRGEYGSNLTLSSLFSLLDCYNYRLSEFFQDIE
jgi:transcriptional regulator with XRE-family HTH domain